MNDAVTIRQMTRGEVDTLVDWAAREGWNPGLHDAELFWRHDSEAFIAAESGGALVGGLAITSYGGEFGSMGLFIVRPQSRGRGIGDVLWRSGRERLLRRLQPGASIGIDDLMQMQEYYARGGFVLSHRDVRYRADIAAAAGSGAAAETGIVPLAQVPFEELQRYDRSAFPARRAAFLRAWIAQPDARALACLRDGALAGYGVVRRCREGCKIGPLFADDAAAAQALYNPLAAFAAGGALYLDVPEDNLAADELVRRHQMTEVLGCARMYLGLVPAIDTARVFGVTTFELG